MINRDITLKVMSKIEDGLGGHKEAYEDKKLYGKIAYKSEKLTVNRANDVNTMKIVEMIEVYCNSMVNDFNTLRNIKKSDRIHHNGINYVINNKITYNNMFIITAVEEIEDAIY